MPVAALAVPENSRRATDGEAASPTTFSSLIRQLGLRRGRMAFFGYCPTCGAAGLRMRPIPSGVEVGCAACGDPGLVRLSVLRAFPEVRLAAFARRAI